MKEPPRPGLLTALGYVLLFAGIVLGAFDLFEIAAYGIGSSEFLKTGRWRDAIILVLLGLAYVHLSDLYRRLGERESADNNEDQ